MARPGTEEKIQVMIARHARFETLYHEHDCVIPKELDTITPTRSKNGGWHNGPSVIFSTPELIEDE
jgi:hypothetical protein